MHRFDIDKLIRSVFRQNKPTVSAAEKDDIWENIEHFLDAEPRMQRRKMGAVWMALVILITSVSGYWGSDRVEKLSSENILENKIAVANKKDFVRNEKAFAKVEAVDNHQPFGKQQSFGKLRMTQTSLLINRIEAFEKKVLVKESLKEKVSEKMSLATIGFKEAYSFIKDIFPIPKNSSMAVKDDLKKKSSATNWMNFMQPFTENPALTGTGGLIGLQLNSGYEKFPGLGKPEYYSSANADLYLSKINSGIGINYTYNISPLSIQKSLGAMYSLSMKTDDGGLLKMGVGFTRNTTEIVYETQENHNYSVLSSNTNDKVRNPHNKITLVENVHASALAGVWYERKHFFTGASVKNLNSPANYYGETIPLDVNFTAGLKGRLLGITATPIAEYHQSELGKWVNSSIIFSHKKVMAGVGYKKISLETGFGSPTIYLGAEVKGIKVFGSYAQGAEWTEYGVPKNIWQAGIRYQIK